MNSIKVLSKNRKLIILFYLLSLLLNHLGVPNVTGFNGARKFKKKFTLEQGDHFFKVDFKPAVMGGKHEIISVTQDEYDALVGAESTSESS